MLFAGDILVHIVVIKKIHVYGLTVVSADVAYIYGFYFLYPTVKDSHSMPLLPNINFGYPFRARRPKRLPDPPQQEEVCIECVKRDQDMADVDVIRPGVWERESDVLYEELKQREQEEEASGNTNVDRSHPKARGASLSEQNLALWLSMVCTRIRCPMVIV